MGKTKVSNRYFNFIIYKDKSDFTIIEQRVEKGIWQNLFQFPLIETTESVDLKNIKSLINESFQNIVKLNQTEIIHKLSHQKLHINFWELEVDEISNENKISIEDLNTFAFPIVLSNFIKSHYEI